MHHVELSGELAIFGWTSGGSGWTRSSVSKAQSIGTDQYHQLLLSACTLALLLLRSFCDCLSSICSRVHLHSACCCGLTGAKAILVPCTTCLLRLVTPPVSRYTNGPLHFRLSEVCAPSLWSPQRSFGPRPRAQLCAGVPCKLNRFSEQIFVALPPLQAICSRTGSSMRQ